MAYGVKPETSQLSFRGLFADRMRRGSASYHAYGTEMRASQCCRRYSMHVAELVRVLHVRPLRVEDGNWLMS